jgi:hypothetical protein
MITLQSFSICAGNSKVIILKRSIDARQKQLSSISKQMYILLRNSKSRKKNKYTSKM